MQYEIMHKDTVIALADDTQVTEILCQALCPACFVVGMPLQYWLESRSVDVHRSHSRQLFKALRLKTAEDIDQLIAIGHAISITDNWWVQKAGEKLNYHSLKAYNEAIADIALLGATDSPSDQTRGYMELGTVGSYEKCWRYLDGCWYMYKKGSTAELLSEYYAYQFLHALHIPVAEYQMHSGVSQATGLPYRYIVTKDFTENAAYDFEPFCNYFSDHEEQEYIIPRLEEKLRVPYVMMLFYDALLYNGDRHNQNVGVLRNSDTGEVVGFAPYFDFNLSLVATNVPSVRPDGDNLFTDDLLGNEACCKILKMRLPERNAVCSAIAVATAATQQAMKLESFKYAVLEDYILAIYDYIANRLQ